MKIIFKIVIMPVLLCLLILRIVIDLVMKVTCKVASIVLILFGIYMIWAALNRLWLQVGIVGGILGVVVLLLLLITEVKLFIESIIDRITI